jgi:16S rRNA processing protein RimM
MSKPSIKDLLHIATLGRTVGLYGDMKFHDKSDFPEQFVAGATFYTKDGKTLTIHSVNEERGLIRIEGYASLESAKKLTNTELYTTMEATRKQCELEEGQHFWFDILGCEVYEENRRLGVVDEVERIAITDYLSIKTDDALVNLGESKSFLVPYQEPFILKTDIEAKRIDVQGALDILQSS